jgi:hypothetical protein
MRRKHLLTARPVVSLPGPGAQAIAAIATVWVPSEAIDAPIDHVFDQRRGPGRRRWIAAEPGEQRMILAFDHPQTVRTITVAVEELEVSRTRALHVSVASAGGQTIQELRWCRG